MGLVRLNTAKICFFVFLLGADFWVRTPQLSSKVTKRCDFRLNFDVFVHLFDNFVQICLISAIHNQFFPQ